MTAVALVPLLVVACAAMAVVHELGHYAAARLVGVDARPGWCWVRLRGVRVGVAPCVLVPAYELAGRPAVDVWIAFAGPLASITVGVALLGLSSDVAWAAGVCSLFAGVGALVPGYPGSDGERILRAGRR